MTDPTPRSRLIGRRDVLVAAGGLLVLTLARPAAASLDRMNAAIDEFTGGRKAEPEGVSIDIPALVENGNSVPLTVAVDSPMTATDFVRRIGVFNQLNPQPYVATFHLSPRAGLARVSTRIRLGDSQTIVAVAEMSDGRFRAARADLIVTLPACVEN